jgi:hypothetical protein
MDTGLDAKRKVVLNENRVNFIRLNPWFDWSKICIINKFKDETIDSAAVIPKTFYYRTTNMNLKDDIDAAMNQSSNGIVVKENYGTVCQQVWVFPYNQSKCLLHGTTIEETLLKVKKGYLIEEYLVSENPIPLDYKVFYSNGTARTCTVVNRNVKPVQAICYSLSESYFLDHRDLCITNKWGHLTPNGQMVDAIWKAVRISKKIFSKYLHPKSTCSLDMYVLPDRILLGEITPCPGPFTCNIISDRLTKILFPEGLTAPDTYE